MSNQSEHAVPTHTVLHVGCGMKSDSKLPEAYMTPVWREVRLDINPKAEPDIVGDIRDMHMVGDNSVDAIFSSHNLEHLYHHEALQTLREFHRVLKGGGEALIACPDLQQVAQLILEDKLMAPVATPPSGPIAPIDMLYGYRPSLAAGKNFMAHKTGFTQTSLKSLLEEAGFTDIRTTTRPAPFMEIVTLAFKPA